MFDISLFKYDKDPKEFGFETVYSYNDIKQKIKKISTLAEAVNYKNQKTLLLLEDYKIEEGALKLIGEKKQACFLIDLSRIIRANGVNRAIELSRIRNFLFFCEKYGVLYAFASFAPDKSAIRSARELMHIGLLLGLDIAKAKAALNKIKEYL